MFTSLLLAATLQDPGFVNLVTNDHMRRLDVAWSNNRDTATRRRVGQELATAMTAEGWKSIYVVDSAIAKLEGRSMRPSDAITVDFAEPFAEPGSPINLRIRWSYRPQTTIPVAITCAGKSVSVTPGNDATLQVNPWDTNPELKLNPEVGTLVPVRVGTDSRLVYVSYVRNFKKRIDDLTRSQDAFVRESAAFLLETDDNADSKNSELPLIQAVFQAEAVNEGKAKLIDLEQILHVRKNDTSMRVQFPRSLRGKSGKGVNVVIGITGRGGESDMFDGHGRGRIVASAIRRGWVFVGVQDRETAVGDAISWLQTERGLNVGKVFVVGQGTGVSNALRGGSAGLVRAGGVIGALTLLSSASFDHPAFIALPKQDPAAFRDAATSFAKSRSNSMLREYDATSETIAAESVADMFAFFDQYAK